MHYTNPRLLYFTYSAVAKRPLDASCMSIVSFNSTIPRVHFFLLVTSASDLPVHTIWFCSVVFAMIIIIIFKTMFMVLSSWQSHRESSPGSSCESACTGCQNLHPPSPFIIITQPESWYSFYRPTEGRRLSRPSWLVTYRDGLPVHRRSPNLVLTGSDVAQLRWSRPTRYH